ncbi:hypothetical protein AU467_19710 [Mesorhizobium loti]|uniref:Uncharacterized protein n=1 Tax=Rhizobium loti TaxID=381 RepID=A0A101KTL5_RHILI|nr:hypothetical protein AU467_19710 [Mesorhizobium loti]
MSLLLVVGRRLAAPLKESVGHKAQMQKICQPPKFFLVGVDCRRTNPERPDQSIAYWCPAGAF